MERFRAILIFIAASFLVSAAIYRDAMWGGSLLAPLDLGPDLFSHYRFMDPTADGIPENHHIIDQFTYDLPLQHTIHKSYKNGEIPWWDPHTYGGRPLLADAHVNGTDLIRVVCYHLLPFELAYNWNLILRGLLTGLGMFLLLTRFGVTPPVAGLLSIGYQFAGWFTLFFGHPWIQGSFVWFPYLWLAWFGVDRASVAWRAAVGGLLCALVFYAGNLQSHTYLPLFAFTFLTAVFFKRRSDFLPALGVCSISGIIGALLAFPVLANQFEFLLFSVRATAPGGGPFSRLMSAPVALAGFYPWAFGSFRSLDAAWIIGAGGMAYTLFCGTTAFFLAVAGAIGLRRRTGEIGLIACHSLLLVSLYLAIIATPLAAFLYARSAALGGMALTVLAGIGTQALLDGTLKLSKRLVHGFSILVMMIALGTSALAWLAYPQFKPAIQKKLLQPGAESQTSMFVFPNLAKMREAQITRFPSEVSIRNPQAALSVVAILMLAAAFLATRKPGFRSRLIICSLFVGLLPVLLFHHRFRPKQPLPMWQAMLKGGSSQQTATQLTRGGLRLDETKVPTPDKIFPYATASLYGVHVVHGYSALQPKSLFRHPADAPPYPQDWRADFIHAASNAAAPDIEAQARPPSRFRNANDGSPAPVAILSETRNSLVIDTSSLDAGQHLVRTDTHYPGWTIESGGSIRSLAPCFSTLVPASTDNSTSIELLYRPSQQRFFLPAIACGLGLMVVIVILPLPRLKNNS